MSSSFSIALYRARARFGRRAPQGGPKRGSGGGYRKSKVHVVALALKQRVRSPRAAKVEVAPRPRRAGALAGDADALATPDARRYFHIDLSMRTLPASASAG